MVGDRKAASSCPPVCSSAFRASSGGHSTASRSWERRPLDTPILTLRSVNDIDPSRSRYWLSFMGNGLDHLNDGMQPKSLAGQNDLSGRGGYHHRMAPHHDWYLKEWLRQAGKKQADVVRDLDWNKARVSLMMRGLQPYERDAVNELATYLNIRPYELLMHPDDAMAIRRLRSEMLRLAHETRERDDSETTAKKVSLN